MKSACSSSLEVVVRWGGDVVDLRRFEQARSLTPDFEIRGRPEGTHFPVTSRG